jgi:hypothetical protein
MNLLDVSAHHGSGEWIFVDYLSRGTNTVATEGGSCEAHDFRVREALEYAGPTGSDVVMPFVD